MNFEKFQRMLRSSNQYNLNEDGILEITDYYTGETCRINLSLLSEDAFDEIQEADED